MYEITGGTLHGIANDLVEDAFGSQCSPIALEALTDMRDRIPGGNASTPRRVRLGQGRRTPPQPNGRMKREPILNGHE